MALNWAMIDSRGVHPVPLPEEKIFLVVDKSQMNLAFKSSNAKWEADGSVYVTNQRIIFLRRPMLPAAENDSVAKTELQSLNVPLSNLVDCRYMIPVFAAPYYEAAVIPVPGGNLPEGIPGGPTVKGLLKIWFLEGKGSSFRDAVEEVRNLARGAQHGEQLPAYQPPPPGTSGGNSSASISLAATGTSSLDERTTIIGSEAPARPSSHLQRSFLGRDRSPAASQLSPEEFEAARVAMREEEMERESLRQAAEANELPPTIDAASESGTSQGQKADQPPDYAAVSPVTNFIPSEYSGGQNNNKVRATHGRLRLQRSLVKLSSCGEGRDRLLQTIHGLCLLFHSSFGSVRRLSVFGVYPVPHIFLFLFPRTIRRETLRRIHLGAEAVDNVRKFLNLANWLSAAGIASLTLQTCAEKERQGSAKASSSHQHLTDTDDPIKRIETPMQPWEEMMEKLAETLALCGEAAEVAALLGGSSIVWRIANAGRVQRGHKALRVRQRLGLERVALWLEICALTLQYYLSWKQRRKTRKDLGRVHRRTLLLTDQLADAQSIAHEAEQAAHREAGSLSLLSDPAHLHDPRKTPSGSLSPAIHSTLEMLSDAEEDFQDLRRSMREFGWEMTIVLAEASFAVFELFRPQKDKEGWEAWSALTAGASGMAKVLELRDGW